MINKKYLIIILLLSAVSVFAQQQEYITVIGDSLQGKMIDGESVREVFGHVVLTQGNVRITCNQAVQYISRNDAELIGNVIATQDTLTITTERGFYYGNERKAESVSGVKLDDKKVILTADTGSYFFNDAKAIFRSNVILKDTSSTVNSKQLIYFKDEGKAIATGDVKIFEGKNIIQADSLVHFRETRETIAYYNVKISSTDNNSTIYGEHLEDYPQKHYTLIDVKPLFIQIDSSYSERAQSDSLAAGADTSTLQIDTLVIQAKKMEAYRDTINIFKATDSVKIVRGKFASINDFTEYYRKEGKIVTEKISSEAPQPIIWYDNSQLTGDSVIVLLYENKINELDVNRNAFILSQNAKYKTRYDQISGSRLKIFFSNGAIQHTEVFGGVHSIYFLYDDNTPNGLTKSSSESAKIYFDDNKVSQVKLYGTPNSEYYPERLVVGNELAFTLPGYIIFNNRPAKEELLKQISDNRNK